MDPELNNDWYLNRFLIARKYHLIDSVKMLDEFLEFRKNNIQTVKSRKFNMDFMNENNCRGLYNTTKDGMPILIERIGYTNF